VTQLTKQIRALERELRPMVCRHAGPLLALPGIGILNAARILANVADVRRFASETKLAPSMPASPPSTPPPDASSATASTARATANSTPPCT
jgi:hypothetical protein